MYNAVDFSIHISDVVYHLKNLISIGYITRNIVYMMGNTS